MRYIDTNEATKRAKDIGIKVSLVTLIKWCGPFPEGFDIGKKIGGRWKIEESKLKLMLEGKQWVLQERKQREEQEERELRENPPPPKQRKSRGWSPE